MLKHVLQLPVCMTVQDEKQRWHFTHNCYSTLLLEGNKITYFSPEERKYYLRIPWSFVHILYALRY